MSTLENVLANAVILAAIFACCFWAWCENRSNDRLCDMVKEVVQRGIEANEASAKVALEAARLYTAAAMALAQAAGNRPDTTQPQGWPAQGADGAGI